MSKKKKKQHAKKKQNNKPNNQAPNPSKKKKQSNKPKQKKPEQLETLVIIDLDDEANRSFLESGNEEALAAAEAVKEVVTGEETAAELVEETVAGEEAVAEPAEETVAGEEAVKAEEASEAVAEEVVEATGEAGKEAEEVTEENTEKASKAEEISEGTGEDVAKAAEKVEEPAEKTEEKATPVKRILEKLPFLKKEHLKRNLIIALCVVVAAFAGYWFYESSQVYKTCSVEAGVEVSAKDFLKNENAEAFFTEESDPIDITVPGEYHLLLKKGMFTHECTLNIKDTIAPKVEAKDVRIDYGTQCEPADFITSIQDATKTEAAFVAEPDYESGKPQTVGIQVTDAGGNITTVEAELIISQVVTVLNWEAGEEMPTISDFVIVGDGGKILTNLEEIDGKKLAAHDVEVELNDEVYNVKMNIVDTTAPVIEVQNVNGHIICKRSADEFVVSGEDVTKITYTFQEEPDTKTVGTKKVTIVATDEGGNQVTKEAELTLTEDTQAPVIKGAEEFSVLLGEKISYTSKVSVEDGCPEAHKLVVDSSKVNVNAVGTYPVTYTSTDCAGHSTSVTINVTVKENVYDINEVNALADKVLAKILTDGMSLYDKAKAIFNYTKTSISYISFSEKGNYIRSAYEGLVQKKGDCYVYASTAKVLLDRAGVPNMDIERIPAGTTMHWWNLVDVGDGHGWYHFDTTPRVDRPVIFLWDDQKMKEYSDSHKNSHNYDRTKYPVIN